MCFLSIKCPAALALWNFQQHVYIPVVDNHHALDDACKTFIRVLMLYVLSCENSWLVDVPLLMIYDLSRGCAPPHDLSFDWQRLNHVCRSKQRMHASLH